jgi:hypothetical protein
MKAGSSWIQRANAPHTSDPKPMPSEKDITKADIPLARNWRGNRTCAVELSVVKQNIQLTPAIKSAGMITALELLAAMAARHKAINNCDTKTIFSLENRCRIQGRIAADATAPAPSKDRHSPKPRSR